MHTNESIVYPPEIIHCLNEKRLALIGFNREDAGRLLEALAPFQVLIRGFAYHEVSPGSDKLRPFHLLIIQLPSKVESFEWLTHAGAEQNNKPLLFIGPSELLVQQAPANQFQLYDFLAFPWPPEEVVLRIYHILSTVPQPKPTTSSQPAAGKTRVLIADDDPTIVTVVKAVLVKHGMECLVAQNGGVAVTLVKAHHPDAVILDINMPFLDGFEVLHAIKKDPQTRHIPVIMLTSLKQESDIVRGFGLGADDYVVKPFRPLELAARLNRLLQRSAPPSF
jgi:two-component system phosphate regulon response regulator PhoB